MMPGPQGAATPAGNALVHYPNSNPAAAMNVGLNTHLHPHNTRLDETDRGFERPPPRNPELFNPKGAGRKSNASAPTSNRASPNAASPGTNNSLEKEILVGTGGGAGAEEIQGATMDGAAVLADRLAGISFEGGNASLPNAGVPVVVEASGVAAIGIGAVSS